MRVSGLLRETTTVASTSVSVNPGNVELTKLSSWPAEGICPVASTSTLGTLFMHGRERSTRVVDCAVLVVTYNSAVHPTDLPDSIGPASGACPVRTIVVDNSSTEDTDDIAAARSAVALVRASSNLGYAGGVNLGRAKSGAWRTLLTVNPDMQLLPRPIPERIGELDRTGVGAVVPLLIDGAGGGSRRPAQRTAERELGGSMLSGVDGAAAVNPVPW